MENIRLEKYLTKKKYRVWDGCKMDYEPAISLISTASVNEFFSENKDVMSFLCLDTNLKEIYELDEVTFLLDGLWLKGFVVYSENGITVIYSYNKGNISVKISFLSEFYITGKNYYER